VGKSKKTKNYRKNSPSVLQGIQFEIEANAAELMAEHLDQFKPEPKDADIPLKRAHAKRVGMGVRVIEIDLHGLTVEEAERHLMDVVHRFDLASEPRTFKVITGKGRHSSNGQGVLIREIYQFVLSRFGPYILAIEESPDAVRIGGFALRGHFHVTLKGP
jgi:DNA-nicking Smr family endonuclease